MQKEFLTGNEAAVKGIIAAGGEFMSGYPITPTTEIIQYWAKLAEENKKLIFLQTEDEMSAGFAAIGGVLAGKKTFTATAGPGNVLAQDPFSMAENLRLPIVAFINQRGGPSTGTVIYSQQELNLTCFGGNGEGLRIAYSAANVQEMYYFAIKAFNSAWQYRFPTFVLSDGYTAKTLNEIETYQPNEKNISIVPSEPYLLTEKDDFQNLRNCYNLETELHESIEKAKADWDKYAPKIAESETFMEKDAKYLIIAHGNVAEAAKVAIENLRQKGYKIGLFRPVTLNPFDQKALIASASSKQKLIFIESSLGQLARLAKNYLYGTNIEYLEFFRPAMGFTPQDIEKFVAQNLKNNKWFNF